MNDYTMNLPPPPHPHTRLIGILNKNAPPPRLFAPTPPPAY